MAFNVGTAVGYLDLDTSGFNRGFKSAMQDLTIFQDKTATFSDKMHAVGSGLQNVGSSMTKYVTAPIAGLGAATVGVAAKFETAMSEVQAISGATGDDFKKLTDKAQEMGATTKFSASESAAALKYMAMAGWDTEAMLDGIEGVMMLAAASGEDLAATSDIVTDAMTAFGLSADQSGRFADVLAQTANRSNTSVALMGETFKYVAPVAGALGYSIEDTSVAIGLMANSGIKGSMAGTSLKNILVNLAKPSDQIAGYMEALGISLTDASGQMLPMNELLIQLRESFDGLSESERAEYAAGIAGKEGMAGLLAIVSASEEDFNKLTTAINNSSGAAKDVADVMMDNLSGQLTIIKSTIEGIAISFGNILLPAVKKVATKLQDFLNWLNNLNEEQKTTIVRIAGIVAAIGPVLLIVGKLLKAVSSIKTVISLVGPMLSGVASALGTVILPVAAVVAAVVALGAAFKHLWETNEEFKNKILSIWEEIKSTFSNLTSGIVERINSLGFDFKNFTEVLKAAWEGLCEILGPIFEGAFKFISNTFKTISDIILSILDIFIGVFTGDWEKAWDGVKGLFKAVWDGMVSFIKNILNTLKNVLNVFLGWFGTSWDKLWTSVKNFFTKTWNSIVDFFSHLPERLGQILGHVLGKVTRWISDTATAVKEIGPKVIEAIVKFFAELPGKIHQKVTDALNKIKQWGTDIKNWASSHLPGILSGIVDHFKQMPSQILQVGKDLISGLWNGITSMGSWIKDKIFGFAKGIIDGFKAGFDEHSPSKKTRSIGQFLTKGLALGIEDETDGAVSSIGYMSKSVLDKAMLMAKQLSTLFFGEEGLFTSGAFDSDSIRDGMFGDQDKAVIAKYGSSKDKKKPTGGNTYNFYSPKAIDPVEASSLMRKTAQELALEV